jgi:hypothetical protein
VFAFEQETGQNPPGTLKNGILSRWHNIGLSMDVKMSVTLRVVTVAVGILVAMVIALTMWLRSPETTSTDSTSIATSLPFTVKSYFRIFLEKQKPF